MRNTSMIMDVEFGKVLVNAHDLSWSWNLSQDLN